MQMAAGLQLHQKRRGLAGVAVIGKVIGAQGIGDDDDDVPVVGHGGSGQAVLLTLAGVGLVGPGSAC